MLADLSLCACGSGLRTPRCCGLDPEGLPPAGAAAPLLPVVERAAELERRGVAGEAERLCREVLELAPAQPEALTILYRLCRAAGRTAAAEALLRRIAALHPNTIWATHELTHLLLAKGAVAEAEIHARNGVRIAPENVRSHNLMGMVMTEANRPQTGEYHYRRVLELADAPDPIVLANLAWNLKNQGRIDEARRLYQEAAAAAPEVVETLLGWARMEEADRNFAGAEEVLARAERLAPEDSRLLLTRAVLEARTGAYDRALAALDRVAAGSGDGLGAGELLERGRLLDRVGRYDDAFACFAEGNRRCREGAGLVYRAEAAREMADRLTRFFTTGRLQILPRAALRREEPQPIFTLGFPRSGTTLVEQTLSAHPKIAAGDELPFIGEIVATMQRAFDSPLGYPEALAELWMGDRRHGLGDLRDDYLGRVRRLGLTPEDEPWFTDKMPLNETHLGLIALMFPASPLIHVVRHPLDVVLSVFANNLTHGFYCGYSLESAAEHYRLTMELVEHYRAEMTLRYLPVRYEDIVDNQEASVRRMLDFIGEPFDARCLDFHQNRRYARTASYAQVTEPLYDSSRYRWRNYRAQLAPAAEILAPTIARLGYTVD
jgi:tetratricopeptide (TPR) repeat protein